MTLSGLLGKVTSVRFRRLSSEAREFKRLWKLNDEFPSSVSLPGQWIACLHCGAQTWRWPPHGLNNPCPLVAGAVEALGLKTDAERMMALRSGIHIEQASRVLEEFMRQSGLLEEDEDES